MAKMHKIYNTKGNLGNYFQVHISDRKRRVNVFPYKNDENLNGYVDDTKKYVYNYEKIWIGKSEKNPMTEYSGGYGKKWDGNSILLKISDEKYIQIGDSIIGFCSKSPIVEYHSPVGNNTVVYPYAIDSKKRYYLITENVIVRNVPEKYNYDYGIMGPPRKAKIPTGISAFKFDGIYFRYEPEPKKYYEWLSSKKDRNFWIRMKGQDKEPLTKDMYVNLIKSFGKKLGFSSMKRKILANVRF